MGSNGQATIRVLVVDDDFAVAMVHEGFLEAMEGFEVVGRALSGSQALELAGRGDVDLILLDVHLPDLSGLEVLRRLRAEDTGAVDVIMITAASEMDTVRQARTSGVVDYLVKPFSRADFTTRLERYRQSRARQSAAGPEPLSQQEVDRLLGVDAAPRAVVRRAGVLPKGLAVPTLDLVVATLRSSGGDMSAAEIAESCGISRVSARRYLEYLTATGAALLRPRYGSAGRPENRYSLQQ